MLAISARIELAPENAVAYVAAAQKIIEPTHAEPGCLLYSFAIDVTHSNVIWVTEQWQDEDDLWAHLGMPHIVEFLAFCETVEIIDMNVIKFEVSAAGPLELPES
jgi:quinol monooxygenase YgiN